MVAVNGSSCACVRQLSDRGSVGSTLILARITSACRLVIAPDQMAGRGRPGQSDDGRVAIFEAESARGNVTGTRPWIEGAPLEESEGPGGRREPRLIQER